MLTLFNIYLTCAFVTTTFQNTAHEIYKKNGSALQSVCMVRLLKEIDIFELFSSALVRLPDQNISRKKIKLCE